MADAPVETDRAVYSVRFWRCILAHEDALQAAYLDGNPAAASHELQRLARELATLPSRHACSCWANHCVACKKLADQRTKQDVAVEIGHSMLIHPPTPNVIMLDLARARAAGHTTPGAITRYLNGEGR